MNVVLHGLPAPVGERGPIMPGFDGTISDAQLADLLDYLRRSFSDRPPWPDLRNRVTRQRQSKPGLYVSDGNLSVGPSDADIRAHMQPNLCRCGTHTRILKAVRRAAELRNRLAAM